MSPGPSPIRVLTVADHPLVREGIAGSIGVQPDMTLVGQAGNGRDAILTIRTEFPDARVIVLTTYGGDVHILRALKAGAQGYLLKNTLHAELLKTIRANVR